MKVLIVSQFYYPEPFRIHDIAKGLVTRGHEVCVLTTNPNYPHGSIYDGYENRGTKIELIDGVKIVRVVSRPRGKGLLGLMLSYLSFCIKACLNLHTILKEEFDVVYSYQLSPITQVIPAIIVSRNKHIPLYLYCLDLWPESVVEYVNNKSGLIYKSTKYISSCIYRSADRIGVTTTFFADYLCKVCNVDKSKIEYVPQHSDDVMEGIDLTAIDNGCVDICFMGNVGISQNIEMVIKAVHRIKDVDGFRVHIVGSGSKLENAVELANSLHVEDKIIFHGRKSYSEMGDYYKLADVCLLTLCGKTLLGLTIPGKMQNYMAAGKPILASMGGDVQGIIRCADCGICVRPDDEELLADAIVEILGKQSEFGRWGKNSRDYYLQYFTLEKYLNKLESSLEYIVSDKNEII